MLIGYSTVDKIGQTIGTTVSVGFRLRVRDDGTIGMMVGKVLDTLALIGDIVLMVYPIDFTGISVAIGILLQAIKPCIQECLIVERGILIK